MAHTLLLADDSVTIQRVIELTFADEDVNVVAVSDGDQAIARLESAPPDIVLADIGMPGKNGYEVARYVKQSPKLSHIPVVLLTGAFEPVDQARASEVGCDGVLAKPFEPQLVIGRVRELLASESRKAAVPTAAGSASAVATAPPPAALAEPVKEHTAEHADVRADLDDYFDRLDVAFQKLSANPPAQTRGPRLVQPPPSHDEAADSEPAVSHVNPVSPVTPVSPVDSIDPIKPEPPAPVVAPVETAASEPPSFEVPSFEPPVSFASPKSAFEAPPAPAAAAASVPEPPRPPVPVPLPAEHPAAAPQSSGGKTLPSIGEAFAAILASEHGAPDLAGRPAWPSAFAAPEPPPVVVGEDVIEQIVQRVIARMSDQAVRDATREVVGQVAERLVREEIERIKSALK